MKIVMGTHHYPPNYLGGVELVTQRTARWLVERGHTVEVVCVQKIDGNGPPKDHAEYQDGVLVHRLELDLLPTTEPLSIRFCDDAISQWFAAYFEDSRPDLFHSHSSYLLTASPIDAAKRTGIPVVVTLHDFWFLCARTFLLRPDGQLCQFKKEPAECAWCLMCERRRYRQLDVLGARPSFNQPGGQDLFNPFDLLIDKTMANRLSARRDYVQKMLGLADMIISPSQVMSELFAERGFPVSHIHIAPHGLDVTTPVPSQERIRKDQIFRIGYLGQITQLKGVHTLIESVRRLLANGFDVRLDIHGDTNKHPDYSAGLRQLARGEAKIHFHGRYENDSVGTILAEMDVLVVPSLCREVGPLVVDEAFSAKVPVIASRIGNLKYRVRDEVDGLLFEAGDTSDLTRQIQRLIEDPDLLPRLKTKIKPVPTFNETMLEMEKLYYSVENETSITK